MPPSAAGLCSRTAVRADAMGDPVTVPADGLRAHWDAVYAAKAPEEVAWYQARPETSLELIARARGDRQAKLIDVGGGASRLVDLLLDEGYRRVTVLDLSEVALAKTRGRLGDR